MQLSLIDHNEKSLTLSDEIFNCKFNEALIHQVVTAYLAAARAGTQQQKTRSEVSGGGIKPFRQKGTGRARAGTIRSPIWRKGGVVFAAQPRSYQQKVNKKMYRGALCSILSELIRTDRLRVIENLALETFKTKAMVKKLSTLNVSYPLLIVLDELTENVIFASRNLPGVEVCDIKSINPVVLVEKENIIISASALSKLEESLK